MEAHAKAGRVGHGEHLRTAEHGTRDRGGPHRAVHARLHSRLEHSCVADQSLGHVCSLMALFAFLLLENV